MAGNSSSRSLSRRQEKNLLNAAKEAARTEFENPDRIGCPGSRTLGLLARRHPSAEESPDLVDHIGTCSPCFVEYSRLRAAHKLRIRVSYALVSIAAVVVLTVAAARLIESPGGQPTVSQKQPAGSQEQPTQLVLDLRMRGETRSDQPGADTPLRMPRTSLSLSIYLPVGSEEGDYDVALVNSSGQVLRNAAGQAGFRDFVAVLPFRIDLAGLPQGRYELRIRRLQAPWNVYPVLLE